MGKIGGIMNISVVIASFNGEKFIKEQLESIICLIEPEDEIIISDDGSSDNTIDIIKNFQKNYNNIYLIAGPKKGIIKNFENGILNAKNDIIFLSDQDDIWNKNKIDKVKICFSQNPDIKLVMHNMSILKENKIIKKNIISYHNGVFRNIMRSCFWGCCMAFKKEFKDEILPFPSIIPAHDQWIGLIAIKTHSAYFLNEDLIVHRIHGNNKTRRVSFINRIIFRLKMVIAYYGFKNKKD